MRKKKKYILGNGLAFSEEKDLKMLNKYSKEGWHLTEVKYGFYVLEKGEPKDYIYYVDYQCTDKEGIEEYSEILKKAGWEIVKNYENMIFLRGTKESEEVYTDRETMDIRSERFSFKLGKALISLLVIIIALVLWRVFIGKLINIALINLFIDVVIGALIGFTFMFSIGYFKVKLKR